MAKDWSALFKASLIVGLLLGVAVGLRQLGFKDPDVGVFTLLCLAFLVGFAVTSGRLTSLSGPGGVNATFRNFFEEDAQRFAQQLISSPVEPGTPAIVEKGRLEDLPVKVKQMSRGKHAAILLRVGNRYDAQAVAAYEREVARVAKSVTLVVVDPDNHFVGSLRPNIDGRPSFRASRRPTGENRADPNPMRDPYERLLEAIAEGALQEMRMLNTSSIDPTGTRREVLEYFAESGEGSVVVVDKLQNLAGIVFRDELLRDLVKESKKA